MKMTQMNIKLAEHIKDRIMAHSEELGLTSSEFVRHLITTYFNSRHAQNDMWRDQITKKKVNND